MATPPMTAVRPPLPAPHAREMRPFYIGPSAADQQAMLQALVLRSTDELFAHIPAGVRFQGEIPVAPALPYEALADALFAMSQKNAQGVSSFLGDGLQVYNVPAIAPHVLALRGLTTTYTPYQPERSQGTLQGLWLYQSLMATLTGFEAVNASLYDRSTAIFEACSTARRLTSKNTIVVLESLFPGDREVLETLGRQTKLKIRTVKVNPETGVVDLGDVRRIAAEVGDDLAGIVFPQVNSLGNLEDVHALTDLCTELKTKSIAVIDPMLLATGGLVPPAEFGSEGQGADIFVGEGQHLAIGPNFGGPGLGIFGIRYNEGDKKSVRETPGRFVGGAVDRSGRPCKVSVLSSAREQHIKRERATSNICSNQAFIALLVGAAILHRGESGMQEACTKGHVNAHGMAVRLCRFAGVDLKYPKTAFFNEFVLSLPGDADDFIEEARKAGIHVGVNVSSRTGSSTNSDLLISFSDIQTPEDLDRLIRFFGTQFATRIEERAAVPVPLPAKLRRKEAVGLPQLSPAELFRYYEDLARQNVSPDDAPFPLGSCTMKWNPLINDWAASLAGFVSAHPEAPEADVQGALQVLYELQEYFTAITGLAGATLQPVAGAQGELLALKMFQAYHAERGDGETRDTILIPHSAHGTNPATATMAGYNILEIDADETGKINMDHLQSLLADHRTRIAGMMVTNPNTSGVFETRFKEVAGMVHEAGGLVFMDGANMNAVAGQVDLGALGVDAVHNNLHKTWTIPHGGGGPGAGMVAVSDKLVSFLPTQVARDAEGRYSTVRPARSVGSVHRHFGNFAHDVRALTYLKALGAEGIKKMSAAAVLSARYLYARLSPVFPTLPPPSTADPVMHEFILTLQSELFREIEAQGIRKGEIIGLVGKLFLDFGLHSPTVAFPQPFGLMLEPTESYTKAELDRFADIVLAIHELLEESPEVLKTAPHFTPIDKVDETAANRHLAFSERIGPDFRLPPVLPNRLSPEELAGLDVVEIKRRILEAHGRASAGT